MANNTKLWVVIRKGPICDNSSWYIQQVLEHHNIKSGKGTIYFDIDAKLTDQSYLSAKLVDASHERNVNIKNCEVKTFEYTDGDGYDGIIITAKQNKKISNVGERKKDLDLLRSIGDRNKSQVEELSNTKSKQKQTEKSKISNVSQTVKSKIVKEEPVVEPKKHRILQILIMMTLPIVVIFLVPILVYITNPHSRSIEIENQKSSKSSYLKSNKVQIKYTQKPITFIVDIKGSNGMRFLKITANFIYNKNLYSNVQIGNYLKEYHEILKEEFEHYSSSLTMEQLTSDYARLKIVEKFLMYTNEYSAGDNIEFTNIALDEFIIQ